MNTDKINDFLNGVSTKVMDSLDNREASQREREFSGSLLDVAYSVVGVIEAGKALVTEAQTKAKTQAPKPSGPVDTEKVTDEPTDEVKVRHMLKNLGFVDGGLSDDVVNNLVADKAWLAKAWPLHNYNFEG